MMQRNFRSFDIDCLNEIRARRASFRDPFTSLDQFASFWNELESILRYSSPESSAWHRMNNNAVVVGEVWTQHIGEYYYKHTVHIFSYLCVVSNGLAIAMHGHSEPANGGTQTRKIKELYVFPDGTSRFCGKDEQHCIVNKSLHPLYVLSVKIRSISSK